MDLAEYFARYDLSHRHPVNKRIHHYAVPAIYFSVLGLIWCIPTLSFLPQLNWSMVALVIVMIFFFRLSGALAWGMLVSSIFALALFLFLSSHRVPLLILCTVIFVVAWIFQFIGHAIEGARPSFADDMRFLLVGPLWVLAQLYEKLGIKFALTSKKPS